jgi:CBS domain-containing protein
MDAEVYVREAMNRPVVTVSPDVGLGRLAALLAEHHVGAVPVVDGDGRASGIVTGTDVARGSSEAGAITAADVMSSPVVTVRAGAVVGEALREMRRAGVGRLPVLDDAGRVVGVVSEADLRGFEPQAVRDAAVRRRVIDRVIDVGGEVLAIAVHKGVVRLHIRIGTRSALSTIEHMLRDVPGVTRLALGADVVDGFGYRQDRPRLPQRRSRSRTTG